MRTRFLGEEKLIKQAQTAFPKGVTKIGDNVYFFLAYGGSTCTLVVGEKSCVLVDTLNGIATAKEAYEEVRKITDKPIKHIIYTHQHTDHTSGAKVFAVDNPKIYGHKPVRPEYEYSHMLKDICRIRGMRQFGTICSDEERISVGVGPLTETPIGNNSAHLGQLPCTDIIEGDVVNLNLDGIDVTIVSAPGETDEQVFVYFPKYKVLCCGDNYYESWPNLYAIRGSQYRDIASWVKALDDMVTYEAEVLLPGHTHAVIGKDSVRDTLTNYRDALKYVLTETLKGMNEGKTMDELVESVTLPEHLKNLPYLQEYYGTVAWSVRAIYTGYLGWFDGNPTSLGHMPAKKKAEKTIRMMGGAEKVIEEICSALDSEDEQWALELCDVLLNAEVCVERAKELKYKCLIVLGRMQSSANARHYYITYAKQMMSK